MPDSATHTKPTAEKAEVTQQTHVANNDAQAAAPSPAPNNATTERVVKKETAPPATNTQAKPQAKAQTTSQPSSQSASQSVAINDTLPEVVDEAADSVTPKVTIPSVALPSSPKSGIAVSTHPQSLSTLPWLVAVLLLLFVLLSVRYKNNFRFLRSMMSDLLSVRRRNNMFDDTLRETSFLITLDILCVAEVAIMATMAMVHYIPAIHALPLSHILGICLTCVGGLYLLQLIAYNFCGYVFSDRHSRQMWVRSFGISQGLLGIVLFPVVLATIFNPDSTGWLTWVGVGCFALVRIVFIYKGFRIFFTQIGSWVLFLYYLCSLEVIPFILTALGISAWCGL